jgi:hypothetical protein
VAENLRLRNKGESSEFESDQKRSLRRAATCAEHKHASHQTSEYLRQLPSESSLAEREFETARLKRMAPRSLRRSHKHNDNNHIIPTTLRMTKHAKYNRIHENTRRREKPHPVHLAGLCRYLTKARNGWAQLSHRSGLPMPRCPGPWESAWTACNRYE